MAVAVEMNFRGATLEQYDEILGKMGLTPGGATTTGSDLALGSQVGRGSPRCRRLGDEGGIRPVCS
jgi:hypothetical protein